jgi:hypothetical protein
MLDYFSLLPYIEVNVMGETIHVIPGYIIVVMQVNIVDKQLNLFLCYT